MYEPHTHVVHLESLTSYQIRMKSDLDTFYLNPCYEEGFSPTKVKPSLLRKWSVVRRGKIFLWRWSHPIVIFLHECLIFANKMDSKMNFVREVYIISRERERERPKVSMSLLLIGLSHLFPPALAYLLPLGSPRSLLVMVSLLPGVLLQLLWVGVGLLLLIPKRTSTKMNVLP